MIKDKGIIFLGIGFELVAMCVGGFFLGQFVDGYMGWNGLATPFLVIALLISWFFHLLILLRRFEKENAESEPPKS